MTPTQAAHPVDVETVTPSTPEELADILTEATAAGTSVAIWGGGTHRDIGYPVAPDLVVSTAKLSGIEEWEADDLTVVVGAGTPVAELEEALERGGQTALLPERPDAATVGGVVATGTSAYARLRYGPTRDRVLEVSAVTGDGRIVRGGGRVVKNVTGYDLPRLYTGSFGALGVITSLCLKLWPRPQATVTVFLDEPPPADAVHRPRAVLRDRDGYRVLLSGTAAEVDAQVKRLGREAEEGAALPPEPTGEVVWSLRVRPSLLDEAVARLPGNSPFVAQYGVGEVTFAARSDGSVDDLRGWAESDDGRLVRIRGRSQADPWGAPPSTLELQRKLIAAFDPARILEPGRLPGGL